MSGRFWTLLFDSLPPTTAKYPVTVEVLNTVLAHLAFYFRASYIDKHNFTHSAFVFSLQISKLTWHGLLVFRAE